MEKDSLVLCDGCLGNRFVRVPESWLSTYLTYICQTSPPLASVDLLAFVAKSRWWTWRRYTSTSRCAWLTLALPTGAARLEGQQKMHHPRKRGSKRGLRWLQRNDAWWGRP